MTPANTAHSALTDAAPLQVRTAASLLDPADAVLDVTVPAGEPWLARIHAGQTLRIVDLEGNQAVDTLFFNADRPEEHYSLTHTIQRQRALYLGLGSTLVSSAGQVMATIVPTPAAATIPWAVPAPARATPCATRWRSGRCTAAATASWPPSPATRRLR